MSMRFRFSGGSDDIVTVVTETPGSHDVEEYYTYEKGPVMWRAVLADSASVPRLRVTALYDDGGCWAFAVGQVDEDMPLPDWPISISQSEDTHYSAELEVTAPEGTTLANVWPVIGGDQ